MGCFNYYKAELSKKYLMKLYRLKYNTFINSLGDLNECQFY